MNRRAMIATPPDTSSAAATRTRAQPSRGARPYATAITGSETAATAISARVCRFREVTATSRANLIVHPGAGEGALCFAAVVRRDGLIRVVVCGMGGSSLAPLVLGASFESQSLSVLDSTDPAAVLAVARAPGLERTLFLI